jgi:ATP-dependent Lon protease
MDEIGLFPLGLVLLPTEQVPLHIFEPRYRELIGECLDQEEPFGLVFADDDGLRRVGTLASVVEVTDRFDDGRLNVVVEGGDRFRLVELTEGRSFHTGTIEPLGDLENDPPSAEEVERATAVFSRLVQLTGAEVEPPDVESEQPSFSIAARFDSGSSGSARSSSRRPRPSNASGRSGSSRRRTATPSPADRSRG